MIHKIKHLCHELKVKETDLSYIINNLDRFYDKREEVKTKDGFPQKKNGIEQTRILYPSKSKLKIIQKKINRNLLSRIEISDYAYGSIKGRSSIANAKAHIKNKYFFTTDLKKFFPFITNKMVFDMFNSFQFSPTVSKTLTRLVTYKGGVPQGAPTSPLIANLVFIKTGLKLQKFASQHDLTFTTYLDDLTFSSLSNFKENVQFIIQTLQQDGYRISHGKTNYKSNNVVITGTLLQNRKLQPTEKYKQKLIHTEPYTKLQIEAFHNYVKRIKAANN